MKHIQRNNLIIVSTMIVCMVICILWGTVFFVRQVREKADTSSEAPAESSEETVTPPDALDALLLCVGNVENASAFSSSTQGYCDTQVLFFNYRHELYSERFVNGDELYCADVGAGTLLRYGATRYSKGDTRLIRVGEVRSLENIVWADKPISLSESAYSNAFGDLGRGLSDYVLDENTVESAILKTYSEDSYTFVYELVPSVSSASHAKKLKLFGALEDTPSVQSVKMTVVMDLDFYPVSVTYEETYSIVLPLIGETTCKAEYVETFSSFEGTVTIPKQAYFSDYLSLSKTEDCPSVSVGYQLLLSLFEDSTVYELTVSAGDLELPMELSADMVHGALFAKNDAFSFLYQNNRYHLSYGDVHVFSDAEELNQQLLPLFTAEPSNSRAKDSSSSDLFGGAEIKTEDGKLTVSSSNSDQDFLIMIDTATMTLISAEVTLNLSDFVCTVYLTKTDRSAVLLPTVAYTDITESVSAVSFLTTLVGRGVLQYDLKIDGGLQYNADVTLSSDRALAFSVLSASEELPLNLYFADQTLTAVLDEIAVAGSLSDFASLLSSVSDTGVAFASEPVPTHLSSISPGDGLLTLFFEGEQTFSVTLTSEYLLLKTDAMRICLTYRGVGQTSPHAAPSVSNLLRASDLGAFLNGSVYPSLLTAGSIGAQLELDDGAETLSGDLLLNLSDDFAARFETDWNGLPATVVYQNETVFLSSSFFDAYVEANRIETVLNRLSSFAGETGSAIPVSARATLGLSVICDGETLRFRYEGVEVVLQKQTINIAYGEMSIRASALYALPDTSDITHPAKKDCIDLDRLSERLLILAEQSTYSFAGTLKEGDLAATVSRLELCLDGTYAVSTAAVDFAIENSSDLYHIVYDGDAFYLDAGQIKLFAVADRVFEVMTGTTQTQTAAYTASEEIPFLSSLRSVSFQNDILTLVLNSAVVRVTLTSSGIDALEIVSDTFEISLQKTTPTPFVLPSLDGYTDITSACDLLPILFNTVDMGCFDFQGKFDLEVLTVCLKGVALRGTVDFSGEQVKGYACIDVPYLYGLTSEGIPLKQGNTLLRACSIKSEIFVLDDRIYLCRTVEATYGYTQPTKFIQTEKRYLTVEELFRSPETMLAFLLNINDSVLSGTQGTDTASQYAKTSSAPLLLKRFVKLDEKYMLEFNPEAILPSADRLLVYAETDDRYIRSVGVETTVSVFDLSIYCDLRNHGEARLGFEEDDFCTYFPLQD